MGPTSATLIRLRRTWMKGERETNFLSDGQKLRCRAIAGCYCRAALLLPRAAAAVCCCPAAFVSSCIIPPLK